jgi:UDP-N-acetylmuramate dehydrogenase
MRIGGEARYFAELLTKTDTEEARQFSIDNKLKLIPLGSGSNTIFASNVEALVVQVKHAKTDVIEDGVTVGAGKNLAMLISELAALGLDLSALTGIPGTVGGAIFGNAGQGPKGIWIDAFIESVTVFDGAWKTLTKDACNFRYRESAFKDSVQPVIIWETRLKVPRGDPVVIKANIQALLQKRIETQPHVRTAGSCFKAVGDMPAWKLIDAAGLRGLKIGDIEISTKHANFLISGENPTFSNAMDVIRKVKKAVPEGLEVEMRCYGQDGTLTI